jgi:hypothetical protein
VGGAIPSLPDPAILRGWDAPIRPLRRPPALAAVGAGIRALRRRADRSLADRAGHPGVNHPTCDVRAPLPTQDGTNDVNRREACFTQDTLDVIPGVTVTPVRLNPIRRHVIDAFDCECN